MTEKGKRIGDHDFAPVSVVMPCYNSADTLAAALDALLRLSYPLYEIIVVDDCSFDGSYEILLGYAAKHGVIRPYRLERNCGVQAARDFGCREARYEWIASTDSDAVAPEDWLLTGARHFGSADLIGGAFVTKPESWIEKALDSLSMNKRLTLRSYAADNTKLDPYAGGGNMFFRKSAFLSVGGYDQEVRAGEELLLVSKAIEAGFRYTFDPDIAVSHPYTPRCANFHEFIRRTWEMHKWRKIIGRKSRLIRNRNRVMEWGVFAVAGIFLGAALLIGLRGVSAVAVILIIGLLIQSIRAMRGSEAPFPLVLSGTIMKFVRRLVGGFAILLPGGPTRTGWSKRF